MILVSPIYFTFIALSSSISVKNGDFWKMVSK